MKDGQDGNLAHQNKRQRILQRYNSFTVPMVLNPNGIEATFLKLDSLSPGAGLIPFITSNILNYTKKRRIKKENSFMHTKNI